MQENDNKIKKIFGIQKRQRNHLERQPLYTYFIDLRTITQLFRHLMNQKIVLKEIVHLVRRISA